MVPFANLWPPTPQLLGGGSQSAVGPQRRACTRPLLLGRHGRAAARRRPAPGRAAARRSDWRLTANLPKVDIKLLQSWKLKHKVGVKLWRVSASLILSRDPPPDRWSAATNSRARMEQSTFQFSCPSCNSLLQALLRQDLTSVQCGECFDIFDVQMPTL